jgi:signal transduction histidine kinase
MESVVAEARPLAEQKKLALSLDCPDDLPEMVSDQSAMYRILVNLVSNAVNSTDSGSVSIIARVRGDNIEIQVSDTGPGISVDRQDFIFKPFAQATSFDSDAIPGTGLGLAISRELASNLGGALRLARSDRSGSDFVLTVPLSIDAGGGS